MNHPLRRLHQAGVSCCLAADDPAFFGSRTVHGLHREFVVARHILGCSDSELADMARASIEYCTATDETKAAALAGIDAWLESAD